MSAGLGGSPQADQVERQVVPEDRCRQRHLTQVGIKLDDLQSGLGGLGVVFRFMVSDGRESPPRHFTAGDLNQPVAQQEHGLPAFLLHADGGEPFQGEDITGSGLENLLEQLFGRAKLVGEDQPIGSIVEVFRTHRPGRAIVGLGLRQPARPR